MKLRSLLGIVLALATPHTFAEPSKWEKDIAAFEQKDREQPPRKGGIVFTGSSTIRRWTTLAEDFPGLLVVNRGFGGSQMGDVAQFADRLVFPHEPAQIVVFAGSNDIKAGRTPETVAENFKAFVAKVRERLPDTTIHYLEITTSPSRWDQREKVIEANRLIRAFCEQTKGLDFIPVREKLLGPDGMPREDLFVSDRLHPNAEGYRLITAAIRPHLEKK